MPTPPIRILLVDSDPAQIERIRSWLTDEGGGSCRLTYAHSVEAALKRLEHGGLDVVMVDSALPDGPGISGALKIKGAAPDMPVIILADLEELELAGAAAEGGIVDFLVKDHLDGATVLSTVRCIVESRLFVR
jgi:DNA-binding NtrC family response regulator